MVSALSPPAVFGFLDQNYRHILVPVATQIPYDAGSTPILYTVRKFFPRGTFEPALHPVVQAQSYTPQTPGPRSRDDQMITDLLRRLYYCADDESNVMHCEMS
jgi:hypothetical protein